MNHLNCRLQGLLLHIFVNLQNTWILRKQLKRQVPNCTKFIFIRILFSAKSYTRACSPTIRRIFISKMLLYYAYSWKINCHVGLSNRTGPFSINFVLFVTSVVVFGMLDAPITMTNATFITSLVSFHYPQWWILHVGSLSTWIRTLNNVFK